MENEGEKSQKPAKLAKPHAPGITALDTKFCLFSLLYPFSVDRDIHRYVFIFKEDKSGGVFLDKAHYSELSWKYKSKIKETEQKHLYSFVVLVIALVVLFVISLKAFIVLSVISVVVTGYEYLDRRILYLWLRREYNRKRPNAEIEPALGREAD